jgi:hypothetical protein
VTVPRPRVALRRRSDRRDRAAPAIEIAAGASLAVTSVSLDFSASFDEASATV